MSVNDQEIEIKYYVNRLTQVENRLRSLQANLVQPRTHEYNLRFDTPANQLARESKVLRLRRDSTCYLTYKGGTSVVDGVSLRPEIEFKVSDFEAARAFLEALGYRVSMVYEKFRAAYELENVLVTLDQMPYGDFVEIEGPDGSSIKEISHKLGLDWDLRILESYAVLFQGVCSKIGLVTQNLTFAEFKELEVTPALLGILPADD